MSLFDTLGWKLLLFFVGIAVIMCIKECVIDAYREDPEYRAEVNTIFNEIKRKLTKKS